jgi:hypothetical protein
MQVQGSLRRVSEPVVVNHATHGKQMQNIQVITCHFDYGRITEAVAILEILPQGSPGESHTAEASH